MAIMRGTGRHGTFVGRRTELEVMAKLISAAREGRSGAVVVRAAAGLGKTYLLERVVDQYAADMQVLAISGIEAESVFDYAALQRLSSQLPARADRLPGLQRQALQVAVGVESGDPPRSVDLLLDALITRFTDGYVIAAPRLKKALLAYLRDVHAGTADPRWHDVTNRICLDLYDFVSYDVLASKQLEMLRAAGELTVLPAALTTLAAVRAIGGDFDSSQALLDEAQIVSSATGAPPHRSAVALLAAHRGHEELWRSAAGQTIEEGTDRGEGTEVTVALFSRALLSNGLGRHSEALEACRSGQCYDDIGLYGCLLIETVEAAAYSGNVQEARTAAAELVTRASASPTESALGLAARGTAIAKGAEASAVDFQKAITHLERSPLAVYLARTHLVYGEWLRRNGNGGDAVAQLRLAHDLCTRIGADAFAERAARELEAAGGAAVHRNPRYDTGLTARERHISRLVRQGLGNAEVADQLLISHRTVEWHLRNIYNKLGITSRRELRLAEL